MSAFFHSLSRSATLVLTSNVHMELLLLIVLVCAIWLRSYTGRYTCMGRYNRELSGRWSLRRYYQRGVTFKGAIIQRLQYTNWML